MKNQQLAFTYTHIPVVNKKKTCHVIAGYETSLKNTHVILHRNYRETCKDER
jgi:hypothetical protein